jgi:hypothetical protein
MSKEINFIWVGSRIPYKYQLNIRKWRDLNPDYKINLITDRHSESVAIERVGIIRWLDCFDLDDPRQEVLLQRAASALKRKNYAICSKIVRQARIFNNGGYYFNVDIVPKQRLPELNDDIEFLSQPIDNHQPIDIDNKEYASHRFVVAALYGRQGSLIFDAIIEKMYRVYKHISVYKKIRDPESEVGEYYTGSLLISRTLKNMEEGDLDEYKKLVATCREHFANPLAFTVKEDTSKAKGLEDVLSESKDLAARTIQRFFRSSQLNELSKTSKSHLTWSSSSEFISADDDIRSVGLDI